MRHRHRHRLAILALFALPACSGALDSFNTNVVDRLFGVKGAGNAINQNPSSTTCPDDLAYDPSPGSCEPAGSDSPCEACSKRECCASTITCAQDGSCATTFLCRYSGSPAAQCGATDAAFTNETACLSARCQTECAEVLQ
jgi:hypothetical protein